MSAMMHLWVPVLVSTIAVFFASSILNSVLPWHRSDFKRTPDEEGMRSALRPFELAPGEYMIPRCLDMKEMKSAEFAQKMKDGPVMTLTVFPKGTISMVKPLVLWFVYCFVVSSIVACMVTAARGVEAHGHDIFHFTAFTTFLCYAMALWQASIWYARPWTTTIKSTIDGLIYAAITGGIFVWLWPGA